MDSEELTMQVLKKLDPLIDKKLFASTFCSIFEHDEATSRWLSLNYEGSLYLVQRRNPLPPLSAGTSAATVGYRMILLNRKSRDNCIEDIDASADMEFKRVQQYVYYKKAAGENLLSTHQKRVIFFSNELEADQFMTLITEIMSQPGSFKGT